MCRPCETWPTGLPCTEPGGVSGAGVDAAMVEQIARDVGPAGIELAYERFDNRDSGHSTHVRDAPPPDLPAVLAGDLSSASYTLSDMAADVIGLLDVLGLDGAHLVGVSLGGQIAQVAAIEHPDRVRSLTSMSTSTGNMSVGQASPETQAKVFGGPRAETREQVIAQRVRIARIAGSPGFELDEAAVAERAGLAYDRGHDPIAVARQAVATVASGDRTARLRELDLPTLVIHGAADLMAPPEGGRAVAGAIPGAELVIFEGMGHDVPRALWPRISTLIATLVHRVEPIQAR
nr:alpha/beta fold hydrolase [Crossiella sp. S99.1]